MPDDIDPTIKRAILEHERQLWVQTRYQLDVRLRVHRRAGFDDHAISMIVQELERCEKVIDGLTEELDALSGVER